MVCESVASAVHGTVNQEDALLSYLALGNRGKSSLLHFDQNERTETLLSLSESEVEMSSLRAVTELWDWQA